MAEKLDFSIPQKKAGRPVLGVLAVLLLVVLVALTAANLVLALSGRTNAPAGTIRDLSTQQVKDLASKLAQRNLYPQAAAAWRDYLASAELAGPERARIYFQMGTLLEKAGLYGDAIEQYYRSEAAAEVAELRSELNAHIKQCFESLGEFSALRYEMMDRTSVNPSQPAGGQVVAEIGADKVTEAELDARIEESIENQLAPMKAFMTPEQLNEQKKRALEPFRNPQTKQEFLQNWLAEEILYRQALQEDLGQKPEVKRLVHELTRGALSQQLMNEQLAAKIHITDTDLQTYYTANKDKYIEPARAKIRHILVGEEGRANEVLKRLKDGADFAAVAKESSEDKTAKDNGGRITEDVLKGARIPGMGDANEINAAVFAANAPAVLAKAFQTDKGWEIIRVDEKQPERQKNFEEVRPQVMRELLRRKSEEVQREYIKEMMDKHKVIIHTSVLAPAPQEATEKAAPKQ
jgi:peptidyl-prolyl cis-trans isomerase C